MSDDTRKMSAGTAGRHAMFWAAIFALSAELGWPWVAVTCALFAFAFSFVTAVRWMDDN